MKVIKRDGRIVLFDKQKIRDAILSAFGEENETPYAKTKASEISQYIENLDKDTISVEEIQDLVEKKLMDSNRKDIARKYIIYRNDRSRVRVSKTNLSKQIKSKLLATDVENQNANVDERSFGGRMGSVNSVVLKDYALNNCMSEKSRFNHLNNRIYIHDLDSYAVGSHNCLSIPFDDLLAKGFNTRQTDVRPANSVNTAFQLLAVIFQLQSLQQFGGVSATHLDWTMVPYVRKSFWKHYLDGLIYVVEDKDYDAHIVGKEVAVNISIDDHKAYDNEKAYKYAMDMTKKELTQAVEGMYHNLNN